MVGRSRGSKKAITRNDLMESLMKGPLSNEPQLSILEKKDYDDLIHVFSDAFLEDPLFGWAAGLDEMPGAPLDTEKKKELQLVVNKSLLAWMNRPILIRKKGIVVGVKKQAASKDGNKKKNGGEDDHSSSVSLVAAMSIMPSLEKNDSFWDVVTNLMTGGAPPFYTKEKIHYVSDGSERLKSMEQVPKRRQALMKMKESNTATNNYIYIQTLGVLSQCQGTGVGGKLIRAISTVADSLGVPLFLETESKENESWYQHHGFLTLETLELKVQNESSPKQMIWFMIRPPPPPKSKE